MSPLFLTEKSNRIVPCWGPCALKRQQEVSTVGTPGELQLLPPALLFVMVAGKQFITVMIADADTPVTDGHGTWSMSSQLSLH